MNAERRTPAGWVDYLSQEHNPVTLSEFMAGCLTRLLGAQIEATRATEHTEGMLGAIDLLAAHIAARSGLPYASSKEIRAALDAQRDVHRKLQSGGVNGEKQEV